MISRLLILLLGMYGALVFTAWLAQRRLIFPAPRGVDLTPAAVGLAFDAVRLEVGGETTMGWFMPATDARGTVLYSHGNGENISYLLEAAELFHEAGCNVMLYDYGGYGESSGAASEDRCYADIRAAWRYLTETRMLSAASIVLGGRSLGSGPTVQLATEVKPAGIILESAFLSIPRLAARQFPFLPVHWLVRHRFDNEAKIGQVNAPILFIHSESDEIVPFDQGRKLYQLAVSRKELLTIRGGHNDGFFVSQAEYTRGVEQFLDSVLPPPAPNEAKSAEKTTTPP